MLLRSFLRTADRRLIISLFVFATTLAVGYLGYIYAGWSTLDAIYMVVITIFGVGYGEVNELTPEMRIFTIVFIIVGCTSLLYAVGSFINWLTEGQLQQYFGERRMENEIRSLENHVIICGFGRVGRKLAQKLHQAKKPFIIIDRNENATKEARDQGYLAITGDGTDEKLMTRIHIDRANIVATVLPDDATNVFIVLTCKSLNPKLEIVARANQKSTETKLMIAGASKVVMPAEIGADRISNIVLQPNAQEILDKDLKDNFFIENLNLIGLSIKELPISSGSTAIGQSLAHLQNHQSHAFLVVAVRKGGTQTIVKPAGSLIVEKDDTLIYIHQEGIDLDF